jgi:D-alanyl-D-alanine carboxypeptidase
MKIYKGLLVFTILFAVILAGCEETLDTYAQHELDLKNLLDREWLEYAMENENWGGGIALRILSPKGDFFVSTHMGDDLTENVHFRGASTTKTFTAASIMLLHQQGKLDIEDKITDLIPGSTEAYVTYDLPYKDQITIRMLLEHRAGVFDITNNDVPKNVSAPYAGKSYIDYVIEDLGQPEHTFTIDEMVNVVADNQLSFTAPEVEFHYSNIGYATLGKIIERVSGKSYHEFVRDELLTPNGLNATDFPYLGTDRSLPSPYATGYTLMGGVLYETTIDNMSAHIAQGNVRTTPANLANWIRLWQTGKAGLNKQTVDMMKEVKATGEIHQYYGLGCVYTPGLGFGHNGGHVGYMTVMRYDAAQDVALLMFVSCMNADDLEGQVDFMYDLCRQAKDLLGYPTRECEPLKSSLLTHARMTMAASMGPNMPRPSPMNGTA